MVQTFEKMRKAIWKKRLYRIGMSFVSQVKHIFQIKSAEWFQSDRPSEHSEQGASLCVNLKQSEDLHLNLESKVYE